MSYFGKKNNNDNKKLAKFSKHNEDSDEDEMSEGSSNSELIR